MTTNRCPGVKPCLTWGLRSLALLWLVDIIHVPAVIDLDGQLMSYWLIDLPDWFWIAAGVMLVFDIAHALFRLTRNFWSPRLRLTTIASNLLWIALLGFAIAQPDFLSIQGEPTKPAAGLTADGQQGHQGLAGGCMRYSGLGYGHSYLAVEAVRQSMVVSKNRKLISGVFAGVLALGLAAYVLWHSSQGADDNLSQQDPALSLANPGIMKQGVLRPIRLSPAPHF